MVDLIAGSFSWVVSLLGTLFQRFLCFKKMNTQVVVMVFSRGIVAALGEPRRSYGYSDKML